MHVAPAPAWEVVELAARIRAANEHVHPSANGARVCVDGTGFAVEAIDRGIRLFADAARGERDEWCMETAAFLAAGAHGEVLDRHTGHLWSAAELGDWLPIAPLLSGRALAVNEERIAQSHAPVAMAQFTTRVDAVVAECMRASAAPRLRERLHRELQHYARRSALAWPSACGLAGVGDFGALEQLARTMPHDVTPGPFAVAARHGGAALAVFARALDDPDPNHRRAAARELHSIEHVGVVPLVVRSLYDRRSTVREVVLESDLSAVLALPGAREQLGPVFDRLEHDPSTLVRKRVQRWRHTAGT